MRLRAGWALLLGSVLFAGSALGQEQDPAKLAQAKKHMEAGAAFYNDPSGHKCEEASREFRKAYELSGSLNALKAMGVCALELERDGEAIAHFEKFLEKLGDKQHPDRPQVESDLKALRSAVAWVTVSTDRPNVRITDVRTPARGYPITNRYVGSVAGQKIGVHPGQHTFTASGDGVPDLVWRVDITNGSSHTHSFDFDTGKPVTAEGFRSSDLPEGGQPATHTERPIPITVWIFGGLTAALAVPTVIFMVSASGTASDFDEQNGRADEQTLEDLRSDVQTSNLVADIFLGATVASAAATLVFYFTRPEVQVQTGKATSTRGARGGRAGATRSQDGAEASGRWRGVTVKPSFGPSGGGAMLTGRF